MADALTVFFYGPPEPTYSDPCDDESHLYYLVHLDEDYVVGVGFNGFVRSFLPKYCLSLRGS